ncbi:DUF1146 family protein [Bacillaceae bacterium]
MIGSLGISGIVSILLSLVCIALSWWALQAVKFDLFLARSNSPQGKILIIFLSIVIGHGVADFLLDYLGWSLMLKELF